MTPVFGDITVLEVDAIVNAANSSLLGGGGVDGAIHRAAGNELVHECRLLGGCRPGQAKITKGYNLPAKYIIHTVGPFWNDSHQNEEKVLSSCYRESLELCKAYQIKSVAFPCIATGVYGFPKEFAAKIATTVCGDVLSDASWALDLIFCCFECEDFEIYQELLVR